MKITFFTTLKHYQWNCLPKDLLSGIIIAAVSIPISMGYAEVSGLPAVYGLYGSIFPILLFALFSTSPQFILGVDAAPAAIVGAALASLGIPAGSPEALQYIPMIALFTGIWLLLFYLLKAGKIVDFISTPVMGGFISGIALTIILMQIPKILGSKSGSGELLELLIHIWHSCRNLNVVSLLLGTGALAIILISRKLYPKFPMVIVIMAAGIAATKIFHVNQYGVALLSAVEPGMPELVLPSFSGVDLTHAAGRGLMVAVVVMAETLLSENSFAFKNGYKINDNQEILACAAGNLAAAFVGCCPVNGSISRTTMNEQFGGRTQVVSLTAGISMVGVLLFAARLIEYLPVPVLTAIVISALMKVVEFDLAIRLYKVSRHECYIFVAACLGVLFLGTIYGVIIGILLSFVSVILKATNPPRAFLGRIPGRDDFYDLAKNHYAHPIQNTIIYRFSESLFFANIKIFQEDIENNIQKDTHTVIVDAGAITSLDITAADRLEMLAKTLTQKGIRFYITEHMDIVNEQMRQLGIGHLIEEGMVRRTITTALLDAGMEEPYPLEDLENHEDHPLFHLPAEKENSLEEFTWAFGEHAVEQIEKHVHHILEQIHYIPDVEQLAEQGPEKRLEHWKRLGVIDEDEILRRLELHIDELPTTLQDTDNRQLVLQLIEKRRHKIVERLRNENPEILAKLRESQKRLEQKLEQQNPEAARKLHQWEEQLHKKES